MLPHRKLRLLPDNAVPELKWGMRLRRSPARSDPIPESSTSFDPDGAKS
jgi:hypothetical protein